LEVRDQRESIGEIDLQADLGLHEIIGRAWARYGEILSRQRDQRIRELTLREELMDIGDAARGDDSPAIRQRVTIRYAQAHEGRQRESTGRCS